MKGNVSNCFYDKVRILHDLCRVVWFIQKHGIADARKEGNKECRALFDAINVQLQEYIEELRSMLIEENHACASCD